MFKELVKLLSEEIIIYLRKSRSDDPMLTVEEVLAKHESILNEWAERNLDGPIPPENYIREVVSGETINARPGMKQLLKMIESPKIKAVLIVECARLGRPDLEEIGKISKLFRYTNTLIITPQRFFDLRDEYDREAFEREMMRGNEYLEYTKKILRRGKMLSLQNGNYINGVTPYGYEREWIMEGKRRVPSLAVVEEEAKIVKMIFDWYVNDEIGAVKICQNLNAMGVPARKGGIWKKSSVINILKNEHYIGKVVIRKHIDVKKVTDQEIITQCVFNKDFETADGKHPAIIDEATFYKAKNRVRRRPSIKPSEILQNPLASILKCECGKVMIRKKNRNTFRYLCDEQTLCGNASVSEEQLFGAIIKQLGKAIDDLSVAVSDKDDEEKKIRKHNEYVSLLESRLVELEKKELSLWEKYTEDSMPKQVFDKLMEKCLEEKKSAEKSLQEAYTDVPTHTDYAEKIATLHNSITTLSDDTIPALEKNKLLSSVIDKIVYRRPKAIRMTPEEAKAKGVNLKGGWYCPDFDIDVILK